MPQESAPSRRAEQHAWREDFGGRHLLSAVVPRGGAGTTAVSDDAADIGSPAMSTTDCFCGGRTHRPALACGAVHYRTVGGGTGTPPLGR